MERGNQRAERAEEKSRVELRRVEPTGGRGLHYMSSHHGDYTEKTRGRPKGTLPLKGAWFQFHLDKSSLLDRD